MSWIERVCVLKGSRRCVKGDRSRECVIDRPSRCVIALIVTFEGEDLADALVAFFGSSVPSIRYSERVGERV